MDDPVAESTGGFQALSSAPDAAAVAHNGTAARKPSDSLRVMAKAAAEVLRAETPEALPRLLEAACRRLLPVDMFAFHTDGGALLDGVLPPEGGTWREGRAVLLHLSEEAAPPRMASAIYAPVLVGETVRALLAVQSYLPRRYTPEDVEAAEALASLAAAALTSLEQRHASEQARSISERRFRALFEQFPLSVQIFDPEGRTLSVNRAWRELFRLPMESLRHFNPLTEPQLEPVRAYLRRGFGGEQVTIPPHRFDAAPLGEDAAPRPRWLEVTVCPVRGPSGAIREVMLLHRDVTEQKQAEEALEEQGRQLAEAQRLAHLGSWSWTIGAERVTWSAEMFEIYGLPARRGEIRFDDFLALVHPEDHALIAGIIEQTQAAGGSYAFVHRICRPDGAERLLQGRAELETDPDGTPRRLFGTGQDITERRRAEEALQASEESYRTIFELASDAIFVQDVETGAVLDANRKACELCACTLDEIKTLGVGGLSDGNSPYDEAHARAYIARAAAGEPQLFEWLMRKKTGERFWAEVSLNRVRILGAVRILAGVRNIDERKEAAAALQRAHDELEQRVVARTAELAERTAELAEAEQRFRAIVEASPMPLLLSRLDDGVILYANDRLEALLGVPPGSMVHRRTPDFYYDPADRAHILETIRRTGSVRDLELRLRRADGSMRWVSLSVKQLLYDGQPAIATSLLDLTERKQTEEALRASDESYRGLFDALTELVYIQDLDGRFLNVNQAVLDAYGYTREELVGQTPAMLADTERVDLDETMRHFQRAIDGVPQRFDWWGRRKDGGHFPKEVVLTRSTYFGQDVVLAVGRDVTERVRAQEALRKRENHFRRLIEDGSDIIAVVSVEGRLRYASPSTERLLGYRPEERLGHASDELLHPDDAVTLRRLYAELHQAPEESRRLEFRFCHKDGTWRTLEGILRPLTEEGAVTGIVINARDVTERVRHERTLRLQKTLLEAQGEASLDGILVVSEAGTILSYNRRFLDIAGLPEEALAERSDAVTLCSIIDQLSDPEAFSARVDELYANPEQVAQDEILLRDGRIIDRYSAPLVSSQSDYFGRIWFFRDITTQRLYAQSLQRELEIGREIQQSFLPAVLPCPPGWEVAARFHPASQVAGDFYDVFELSTGQVGLVIADVCGKGVGAALFMALFRSLLRANAERASLAAPGAPSEAAILQEAVRATNDYILRLHKPAHTFASVFFGLLNPVSGRLTYINAGHEPPVLVGAAGRRRRLRATGPAVGLLHDAPFQVASARLAPGHVLFAFTDGVTEARDAERAFFTEERLLTLLAPPPATATALLDHVEAAVWDFAGTAAPSDDLTLLAVRHAEA